MKTAEEWFHNLETYNQVSEEPKITLSPIALVSTIKSIQLDAYKAGMTEALEIHQNTPPSEHWECSQAIISARDNKTI